MSHPAIARVDKEALHPADVAIDCKNTVTGSHLCLTHGDNVFADRPLVFRHGPNADELGGAADGGVCGVAGAVFHAVADEIIVTGHRTLDQVELLGVVELVELRECTAQPDFTGCGVYQANRDKPPGLPPVSRLDDKVGDRISGWVDDQAAHLAAGSIRTACLGPDREFRLRSHRGPPPPRLLWAAGFITPAGPTRTAGT